MSPPPPLLASQPNSPSPGSKADGKKPKVTKAEQAKKDLEAKSAIEAKAAKEAERIKKKTA